MASNRGQLMQSFMFTISEDLKLYRQLHTLLTEQKALYLQFNGDALGKNIRQQVPVLNQLHRNASHRTQCLQRLALPNATKACYACSVHCPPAYEHELKSSGRC